ncbi:transcriptional regulator [Catellatospora sp. TT07R-123]|uniref:helix-turn-helix domain-containing protein n=1 Tax=Catellatospora sp. TT07R-123 TaxID=2733863 RepID=UPI001B06A8B3|nr:helix-turn-helix transcriptional regulator [Catellatospora sp. TT07R-123]GHJ49472.1 transcriptional regulator [Catellatospora sp. TT07R-123]
MVSAKSPTVRRRRLCGELRRLREAARMTCDEVGRELGCTGSRISRIESGRLGIRPGDVRELLDVYRVTGPEADRLVQLARDARQRGWWYAYNDVVSETMKTFVGLEAEASSIQNYEAHFVPGLLQAEPYARELFEGVRPTLDAETVQRRLALRMARQQVLHRADPPDAWFILDEAALRHRVGGAGVMRAQLDHLLEIGELPNVTVQVIPFAAGVHFGMGSGFVVFDFPDPLDTSVAHTENLVGAVFWEEQSEVDRCRVAFNHLRSAALSDVGSRVFIGDMAKEI